MRGKEFDLYSYAAGVIVQAKTPALRRQIYELLRKSPNPRTRIILLAVVKRWVDDPEAIEALHGRLRDGRKEVVFAALRWIRELNSPKRSLEPLIAELERREKRARGRVYYDLRKTLAGLTGFDLTAAADWRNYFETYKDNLDKAPRQRAGGRTRLKRTAKFFSLGVDSSRVVFLIDVSASMTIEDVVVVPEQKEEDEEEEEEELGDGTTVVKIRGSGGRKAAMGQEKAGGGAKTVRRSRIDAVKQELIRTIGALPSTVHFNIISFNHEVGFFDSGVGLLQATTANKNRAARWVASLAPNGATRTDLALGRALQLQDVDTVYLLTDGAPKNVDNQKIPPEAVLAYVRDQNRFRKCRINTIGFLQAGMSMRQFCKDLAKQNDGRCVLLK
ncbi:MAG: hypothetical protein O7J95_08005 [Planctomycetota bacterium]|nr:hypothetical protein [Planctomycetota bacterium]